MKTFLRVATQLQQRSPHRARLWQARLAEAARAEELHEHRLFERTLGTTADDGRILLGRARDAEGEPFWAGMPLDELLASHLWITGSTGSGKTFLVIALLMQILERTDCPIVVLDMKGELSQLLRDIIIPALATTSAGHRILEHLRVVRPFDQDYLPELRVTAGEEGVSREVQAHALTAGIAEALGDDLGARMNRISLRMTTLALELEEPLTVVKVWLEDPRRFLEAARRSNDPATRSYAATAFAQESRPAREALLARLDTFFLLSETRLALSAPTCLSFADALERGLTILDLGDPPAGAESVSRFWAGILIGRLTRAILSRRVTADSPRAVVAFEEFQEGLQRHQVESFSRLLALARYKRVSLWFANQQASQVGSVDQALVKLLRTNTAIELAFRCNLEDAKAFAHAIPVTDTTRSAAEVHAELTAEMTRLPDRTCYFWNKKAPYRARKIRSPRLDLAALRRRAASVPEDVLAAVRRGTVAVPRAVLEELVASASHAERDIALDGDSFLGPTGSLDGAVADPELG